MWIWQHELPFETILRIKRKKKSIKSHLYNQNHILDSFYNTFTSLQMT